MAGAGGEDFGEEGVGGGGKGDVGGGAGEVGFVVEVGGVEVWGERNHRGGRIRARGARGKVFSRNEQKEGKENGMNGVFSHKGHKENKGAKEGREREKLTRRRGDAEKRREW